VSGEIQEVRGTEKETAKNIPQEEVITSTGEATIIIPIKQRKYQQQLVQFNNTNFGDRKATITTGTTERQQQLLKQQGKQNPTAAANEKKRDPRSRSKYSTNNRSARNPHQQLMGIKKVTGSAGEH
jgi:hypothetical protein